MKQVSVIQVGSPDAFPAGMEEAARLAFPQSGWSAFSSPEALPPPTAPTGFGVLVIHDGHPGDAAAAADTTAAAYQNLRDPEGLPCWSVIQFGPGPDSLPFSAASPAAAVWSPEQLAHVFKSSLDRLADQREAARLRGEMLTVARRISHDLRTALGGILSTIDVLAETLPASRSATGPLFSSVDEMTHLISRTGFLLKAIALPQPAAPVKMAGVVATALSRLESLAARQGAVITQPESWPEVWGVASWVEAVWWNLLHNALRFSPSPVRLLLAWERLPGQVKFSVRHQDPAIPTPPPPQGIRPFHQLHDPSVGKGLGLAIVRRLTELQGGGSGHEFSDPAAGTGGYYWFTLPDAAPAADSGRAGAI